MKSFLFSSFLLLFSCVINAQVGIGTTLPYGALDVTSTTEGLLIPRVALVNTTTVTVLTATASELVYNTATAGDVTPGFYYLSTAAGPWVRLATSSGAGWLTTGNSGLSGTTNFLGTTDGVDLAFRRNNTAAGKIGATSTSFGVGALNAGAATNSVAFGTSALTLNTGANNVAVGNGTLAVNVSGIQNTGVGNAALAVNTGSASTAIGFETLKANTSGNNGTAVGFQALAKNTTASNNTGIGFQALTNNTTGAENTAVGFQASMTNSTGNKNTSLGWTALSSNNGSFNVAIGHSALARNTGSSNTVVGYEAVFGAISGASDVTAVGWHALFNNSANESTAVGSFALQGIGSAVGNTAVGYRTLNNNSTGQYNTAVGNQAGFAATSSNNTFLGYFAGQFSGGANNTVVGSNALKANAATANNVAIGYNALAATTGSSNVAIGYNAGSAEIGSNKLYIENSNADANSALIYGEFDNNFVRINGDVGIGTAPSVSNKLDVAGNTKTTNFQMTAGAAANYILQSDAAGNGSWVPNTSTANALSLVRADLGGINQILFTPGAPGTWEKIDYTTVVFDTNSEFAGGTYTSTKAGFFQINAGFHTNDQSNTQQYSIGVFVNGALYQETSGNHAGIGEVARNVNCMVSLAIGDTVEIYVKNYVFAAEINGFTGKTFFEVQQIK